MTTTIQNKSFSLFAAAILALPSFFLPHFSATGSTAPNSPAGTGTSLNWSGYTATGGTFTSVGAHWTVPAAAAPSGALANALSADATWVGIGGVSSRDLIQAGTQTVFQDGTPSYEAWYETLPQDSEEVPLAIHPGDAMTVSLQEQSGDVWVISFADNTTGQSYSTSVDYQSSLSSAEWIEEMPSAPQSLVALDNFGTASFTNGFAVKNGAQMTLAGAGAQSLTMINGANVALAVPSSLGADGASFAVTRTSAAAATGSGAASYGSGGYGTGTGRWTRTGVGVQGYTAPTRTFRTSSSGGYGFNAWRLGNFSVFFRNFQDDNALFKQVL